MDLAGLLTPLRLRPGEVGSRALEIPAKTLQADAPEEEPPGRAGGRGHGGQ
jgi:hypothetical protein